MIHLIDPDDLPRGCLVCGKPLDPADTLICTGCGAGYCRDCAQHQGMSCPLHAVDAPLVTAAGNITTSYIERALIYALEGDPSQPPTSQSSSQPASRPPP